MAAPRPNLDIANLASQSRALTLAQRYDEALAVIDFAVPPSSDDVPLAPALALAKARALCGLERSRAAEGLVTPIARKDPAAMGAPATPLEHAEALLMRARLLRRQWASADWAAALARQAATLAGRLGEGARVILADAHGETALLFARKRCRKLAERELARAREAVGESGYCLARLESCEAAVLLEFDERAAARECYQKLLGRPGREAQRMGRLGLADVALLLGDFPEAHRQVDAAAPLAAADLGAHFLRIRLLAAEERWNEAANLYDHVLTVSPKGDGSREWRSQRAAALFRAGRKPEALAAYRELAAEPLEDHAATVAQRMLRVAGGPGPFRQQRLKRFPTVAQLRDHCGPATCELYLRYFGIAAEQVEIARAIKLPNAGTPTYAMRRFLEKAGLEVRRIEAELPVLQKVIDLGLPLILEEEYSSSRHVAVAIGYDDERQVVEVQDPMTHELRETPYEELPKLLDLANNGAIIALQLDDHERRAALDAAGIPSVRYIDLVDEAFELRDAGKLEEADRKVDEAIALHRDYELAWIYRFQRARTAFDSESTPARRAELGRVLDQILQLWPDDEWPQQYVGYVLYTEDRYDEALAAYEKAAQRDPGDGNNFAMIGDCWIGMGRRDQARRPLEEALLRLPWHDRANENLADILEADGELPRAWILNQAARELRPDNPFNHEVHARLHERRYQFAGALAAYDDACQVAPERTWAQTQRAKTLAKLGRIDEALEKLGPTLHAQPGNMGLRVDLADLLYHHGRPDKAMALCQELIGKGGSSGSAGRGGEAPLNDPKNASAYAILGACQASLPGLLEAGLVTLRLALQLRPGYAWVYAEMGRHLEQAGRQAEAIQAYAAATGLASSANNRFALGSALAQAGALDDGVAQLRSAVNAGALEEDKLVRVAEVVAEKEGIGGAEALMKELAESRVDDPAVLRAHVRLLVEIVGDPERAAAEVAKLAELEPDDPIAVSARGWTTMAGVSATPADVQRGEGELRAAIERAPAQVVPRVLLATALNAARRFPEAFGVLGPCGQTFAVVKQRVLAMLGQGEVKGAVAAVNAHVGPRNRSEVWELQYLVACHKQDWRSALDLANKLSVASGEHEDDGQLSRWEIQKFGCLLRIGEAERAEKFGQKQIATHADAAKLAEVALAADSPEVSQRFAALALRLHQELPVLS